MALLRRPCEGTVQEQDVQVQVPYNLLAGIATVISEVEIDLAGVTLVAWLTANPGFMREVAATRFAPGQVLAALLLISIYG